MGLCHGVFTERFILDYLFAENRLLELTWVIRSMKREEKKMAALSGDVFISKLRKFRLSFAAFQYSNPSFPYISQYPLQIFLTCELNSQECGSSLYFYLYLFIFIFACIKGHPSSDSGPSKENFMKRVQIQDDEEAKCQRWWRARKQETASVSCVRVASSQESLSTQSVKEILRRRIEQKWVQQNEERFSRSQDNASLSNWASILLNLGYFCEVRSIIAACGKIHSAYCRFDHWTVKSQVHLH